MQMIINEHHFNNLFFDTFNIAILTTIVITSSTYSTDAMISLSTPPTTTSTTIATIYTSFMNINTTTVLIKYNSIFMYRYFR